MKKNFPSLNILLFLEKCRNKKPFFFCKREPSFSANKDTPVMQIEKDTGNIHSFNASKEGCVFMDLFVPPYDPPARDCSYYKIVCEDQDAKKQASDLLGKEKGEMIQKVDSILCFGDPPTFPISLEHYTGIKPISW